MSSESPGRTRSLHTKRTLGPVLQGRGTVRGSDGLGQASGVARETTSAW